MPNSSSVQAIQPVRSSGMPPWIAAITPVTMMTTMLGTVNRRSLLITPSIAWAMSRGLRVRAAWRCQNTPVVMLPRNMMTATMCSSFIHRYISVQLLREKVRWRIRASQRRKERGARRL